MLSGSNGATRRQKLGPGRLLRTFSISEPGSLVISMAYSPDGRTIAAGTQSGDWHLWDAAMGRLVRKVRAGAVGILKAVGSIAVSSTGLVASGTPDGNVRNWKCLFVCLAAHAQANRQLCRSPHFFE